MKLAAFADLHLTNRNSKFRVDADGVSDLLKAQAEFVNYMCEHVEADPEIKVVAFLGDLTDYNTLDPVTLAYTCKVVRRLVDTGRDIILLGGNHTIHDRKANFSVLGGLSELLKLPQVHFVTKGGPVDLNGIHYWCAPYQSDAQDLADSVRQMNAQAKGENHVLLFHFPLVNAMLDNGLPSVHGVELRQPDVSNFEVSLGGDFHRGQLVEEFDHLAYVGSPFSFKFNERTGKPRGFVTYDHGKGKLQWHENPFAFQLISVEAKDLTAKQLASLQAGRSIVKLTGDLPTEAKAAIEDMGFYRIQMVQDRQTVQLEDADVFTPDTNQNDQETVLDAIDKLASEEIKPAAQTYAASVMKGEQ